MPIALNTIPTHESGPRTTTLHFAYIKEGEADYKFIRKELIVGKEATLYVTLEAGIPGGPQHDGKDIDIFSYCCTETELSRVRLVSWSPKGIGDVDAHMSVSDLPEEQARPLTDHKQPGQFVRSIRIDFALEDRQLVFVGVIVRVTIDAAKGKYEYFLCDPQVGNGPPGSEKDWLAAPPLM